MLKICTEIGQSMREDLLAMLDENPEAHAKALRNYFRNFIVQFFDFHDTKLNFKKLNLMHDIAYI